MKLIFFYIFLFFSSCTVGPNYQIPNPAAPSDWKTAYEEVEVPHVQNWWELFCDDRLNDLETQAIENSPKLLQAIERVAEARAIAGIASSDLYPQLDLYPSYQRSGMLYKLQGLPPNLPGIKPIVRIQQVQITLPATLSYELDLWGKYHKLYESAIYNAQAIEEAYHASLLTLTADLASFYYHVRSFDAQIEILKKNINLRKNSLNLNRSRFKAGIVGAIDVSRAELELANTESEYQDTERQRTLFVNAIATLIGIPATNFYLEPCPLLVDPPLVPPGLPSAIIIQRPDIAQAERTMAAQHAEIGAAYADFFPSITLTGTLGFSSPDLKNFLSWKSRYWAYGANTSQFLFDAGRRCSNVDATWARFGQAEAFYQQIVLTAFQEVEDSLNNIEWEARQYATLQDSVRAAAQTLYLSTRRYANGIASYYEVIDSQRSDLNAQINSLIVLRQRYLSTIQLIKAIGGSWIGAEFIQACAETEMLPQLE